MATYPQYFWGYGAGGLAQNPAGDAAISLDSVGSTIGEGVVSATLWGLVTTAVGLRRPHSNFWGGGDANYPPRYDLRSAGNDGTLYNGYNYGTGAPYRLEHYDPGPSEDNFDSVAVAWDTSPTGQNYGPLFTGGYITADLDADDENFLIVGIIDPRDGDADYWSAAVTFWLKNPPWAIDEWFNRVEMGVCYDSGAGGLVFYAAATRWDPDAGAGESTIAYGPAIDVGAYWHEYPVQVAIRRTAINGIDCEIKLYYRKRKPPWHTNAFITWGEWTEFTGINPDDYLLQIWTDPGLLDLSEDVEVGYLAYTAGAANKKALVGPIIVSQDDTAPGASTTIENHEPEGIMEWTVDFKSSVFWEMSTFNAEWIGFDSDHPYYAEYDYIRFAWDVTDNDNPSYSGWLTLAQMQAATSETGRYFHFKVKLLPDGAAPATNARLEAGVLSPYHNWIHDFRTKPRFIIATVSAMTGGYCSFEASPTEGVAPLAVRFDPTRVGLYDFYRWDFGDESSPSYEASPTHTYQDPGLYSPSLTAGQDGDEYTYSRANYIAVSAAAYTFAADFEGSPLSGVAPLAVRFWDKSNVPVTEQSWTLSDGTITNDFNPLHVFQNEGSYNVGYGATTIDSQSDSETKNSYIMVSSPTPTLGADFGWESSPPSDGGEASYIVNFTDRSTGTPTGWSWDFGEGSPVTSQNPSHTYTTAGVFDVTLTITRGGDSDAFTWFNAITVWDGGGGVLNPDASYGKTVWHYAAGDEYTDGVYNQLSGIEHFEFSLLRGGGLGPARMTLAREWADRSNIAVGDVIVLLHNDSADPINDGAMFAFWFGYVDEIRANRKTGSVDYLLVSPTRYLSDIYPGGNDDDDKPIVYRLTTSWEFFYGPDENDPDYLAAHYDIKLHNITDIVKHLHDRYLAPLKSPGGLTMLGSYSIDESSPTTDLTYAKFDGSINLADALDSLAMCAKDYTWGMDCRCIYGGGLITHVEPFFFFRRKVENVVAHIKIGTNVSEYDEMESKQLLYNELHIEGAYFYSGMPFVTAPLWKFRDEGSIARWGRRRLSLTVPWIKHRGEAQQYADQLFAKYAHPQKFIGITQLGGQKRLQPWWNTYAEGSPSEVMGGQIVVKDSDDSLIGVYDFDESRCVFGKDPIWRVKVGPRDPQLRPAFPTMLSLGEQAGGLRSTGKKRKTRQGISKPSVNYLPVFLGYARVESGTYDATLKDYLYTIIPLKGPDGGPPLPDHKDKITGVFNIQSVLLMPSVTGSGKFSYSAREIIRGTIVNYHRGWNLKTGVSYYYISEQIGKVFAYDIRHVDKGVVSSFKVTADIPPESAYYNGLRYDDTAPTVWTFIQDEQKASWIVWISWTTGETPKLHVHGKTVDNLPRATSGLIVSLYILSMGEKRSDWGYPMPLS